MSIRFLPRFFTAFFKLMLIGCAVILQVLSLVGCNQKKNDQIGEGFSTRIPLYDESTQDYTLKEVQVSSVSNLNPFRSSAIDLFLNAGMAKSGKGIIGASPVIQGIWNQGSVFIAGDVESLQYLTLTYGFEALRARDKSLGIEGNLTWPRKIAISPKMSAGMQFENNALYSQDLDTYMFFPYSEKGLPLTVNLAVVAHEHFHAHFAKMVMDVLVKTQGEAVKDLNTKSGFLLRAWNEGLADLWGYSFNGDEIFVDRSISEQNNLRSVKALRADSLKNADLDLLSTFARDDENKLGFAYELGTRTVRWVRFFMNDQIQNKESRNEIAKAVVKVLPLMAEELKAEKSEFNPGIVLRQMLNQLPIKMDARSCAELPTVLDASEYQKVAACKEFLK